MAVFLVLDDSVFYRSSELISLPTKYPRCHSFFAFIGQNKSTLPDFKFRRSFFQRQLARMKFRIGNFKQDIS
jgi:hypothetical protein